MRAYSADRYPSSIKFFVIIFNNEFRFLVRYLIVFTGSNPLRAVPLTIATHTKEAEELLQLLLVTYQLEVICCPIIPIDGENYCFDF